MAPESALKQMDNGKFEEVEVDDVYTEDGNYREKN